MNEDKTITVKEALRKGYEFFFTDYNGDHCYSIREDAQDHLKDGELIYLADPADHMILDAQNIFENACEELHEAAFDNVYMSEEYKLFVKVCEYVSQRLKDQTQSYRITDVRIISDRV